jgi:hypothetical protein
MNPSMKDLKDFFDEEKKRVVTPDPFFHVRVMARLGETRSRDFGIWEVIPGSTRSVFALAVMLMLLFVAVQAFVPQVPERGFVDSLVEAEQSPRGTILNSGTEMPADQEFFNKLMGFDDSQ